MKLFLITINLLWRIKNVQVVPLIKPLKNLAQRVFQINRNMINIWNNNRE